MTTVLASFVAFTLAVAAMAVGVIAGRAPIRGSCGGGAGHTCTACARRCGRRAGKGHGHAANREKDAC